jgi:hypothetical protein
MNLNQGNGVMYSELKREEALNEIKRLVTRQEGVCEFARTLYQEFQFDAEDLTEAGLDYEMVRAIEGVSRCST